MVWFSTSSSQPSVYQSQRRQLPAPGSRGPPVRSSRRGRGASCRQAVAGTWSSSCRLGSCRLEVENVGERRRPGTGPVSASQTAWTWARTRSSLARSSRGGVTAPGDHQVRAAEEILVVRAARGAVGEDQGRLSAPAGPAAPLGVVAGVGGTFRMLTTLSSAISTPSSIVGEQYSTGSSPVAEPLLALAAAPRTGTWAVCSRASKPRHSPATVR